MSKPLIASVTKSASDQRIWKEGTGEMMIEEALHRRRPHDHRRDAARQRRGRRNRPINRRLFHERTNDAQVLLGFGGGLHVSDFAAQSRALQDKVTDSLDSFTRAPSEKPAISAEIPHPLRSRHGHGNYEEFIEVHRGEGPPVH